MPDHDGLRMIHSRFSVDMENPPWIVLMSVCSKGFCISEKTHQGTGAISNMSGRSVGYCGVSTSS